MKHLTSLLILIFSTALLSAQEYQFYPHFGKKYKVTAKSGLNLRSKPNVKSEIIKKIPLGERVQLLHKDAYGYATLDSIVTQSQAKYYAKGFWIKVIHNEDEGFLNTAYLYPVYESYGDYKEDSLLNKDYVLLMPGFGCRDNVIDGYHDFKWYGLYRDGDKSSLQEVQFEYYRADGEMSDLSIVTQNDKNLLFIIGSKRGLQVGPISEAMFEQSFYTDSEVSDTIERISFDNKFCQVSTKGIYQSWKSNKETIEKYQKSYKVFAKQDDQLQLLNEEGYMNWVGDIDQDGYMDYICSKGEKNMRTYLFLSSERTGSEIVKPVGVFYSGYCC